MDASYENDRMSDRRSRGLLRDVIREQGMFYPPLDVLADKPVPAKDVREAFGKMLLSTRESVVAARSDIDLVVKYVDHMVDLEALQASMLRVAKQAKKLGVSYQKARDMFVDVLDTSHSTDVATELRVDDKVFGPR